MVTKRELKAMLKNFRNPPSLTMEQALASERPVHEIGVRIVGDFEQLTEAEQLFWAADYFMNDTLNGGLHQTLSNDTGYWFGAVERLMLQYSVPELSQVFSEVRNLFPDQKISLLREARNEILDQMDEDGRSQRLDELTSRIYECEDEYNRCLVQFASEHKDQFRGLL
jgi:hypothetical protein